ncbi:MAG: hypothetical protein GX545_07470 [Fibrobacter sp.]|jgi:hypothetical protein|nr:hypothetical protein [Fibrobacter sp.]
MRIQTMLAAFALCATQSFAIFGIGGHYSPSVTTKLNASKQQTVKSIEVENATVGQVLYAHKSFSSMQGFGFKAWIDILPIIDIEATYNIQWGSYDASLFIQAGNEDPIEQPLEVEFGGVPFGKATPKYVGMNGDLSVTYPITFLPIVRPYVGAGITYFLNTPLMDSSFIAKFMNSADNVAGNILLDQNSQMDASKGAELAKALAKEVAEEGLQKSIGAHILLGVRIDPPIIPIAFYVNGKYYIGGDFHDDIEMGRFVFEVGAGFAL